MNSEKQQFYDFTALSCISIDRSRKRQMIGVTQELGDWQRVRAKGVEGIYLQMTN